MNLSNKTKKILLPIALLAVAVIIGLIIVKTTKKP
jgi:hypothetical protein